MLNASRIWFRFGWKSCLWINCRTCRCHSWSIPPMGFCRGNRSFLLSHIPASLSFNTRNSYLSSAWDGHCGFFHLHAVHVVYLETSPRGPITGRVTGCTMGHSRPREDWLAGSPSGNSSRLGFGIIAFSSLASLAQVQLFNHCSLAFEWHPIAVLVGDNQLVR